MMLKIWNHWENIYEGGLNRILLLISYLQYFRKKILTSIVILKF
jgi:hypothetical protein